MGARRVIVALATAWGPRFGGINAFNAELLKSLGIFPGRDYELLCVVPGPETQERFDESRRYSVELRCIDTAAEIARQLGTAEEPERFLWMGHDDKTGPLALELKQLAPGSRAVLINHMAHGAYQSVKKGSSASARMKEDAQRELFRQADLCLAVGPMLRDHLNDLLRTLPKRSPHANRSASVASSRRPSPQLICPIWPSRSTPSPIACPHKATRLRAPRLSPVRGNPCRCMRVFMRPCRRRSRTGWEGPVRNLRRHATENSLDPEEEVRAALEKAKG